MLLATAGTAGAATPSDLRDYALAACLTKQTASAPLRDEGYQLADVVIARAGGDPFAWQGLRTAVETTLAARRMLMVHADGPVAQSTRPAPLATCLQVIDAPAVRRAMVRTTVRRR